MSNRNDKCYCGSNKKYKKCCLNDTKYGNPKDHVDEKYNFFTTKAIPIGAYLTTPPQLGSIKLYIIGKTEGLCKCEKHNHIILKLEGGVICGWCDTVQQYIWGVNK